MLATLLPHLNEWLNLLLRWAHLIFGISWIGSSFYFMWLDKSLSAPTQPKEGVEGELWMVHSGGFYQVEKYKIRPGWMPDKELHWFKFEALFTWVTGFLLLSVVYYLTGGAFLVDPAISSIAPGAATAVGIGTLVVGWFAYDLFNLSRLSKHRVAAPIITYAVLAGIVYGFTSVFSGRAAYIHVGALFGTIMVANVWVRILPAQQKMLDAVRAGQIPDYELGQSAKRRSVHNSYMTLPVLFIMVSNHFPTTYANPHSAVVLALLTLVGVGVRHHMIHGSKVRWVYAPVALLLAALIIMTAPLRGDMTGSHPADPSAPIVTFTQAHSIIQSRCLACHSMHPADATFGPTPGGVSFEQPDRIHQLAARIKFRAVESKTMPLANKTGITDEERVTLGAWVDQGARVE